MSDELKKPLDPDFVIDLPAFQGPLDLLLHLIQKHELEILDLPIAFVTDKYLAYLGLMEHLNLDIAAEYLLMAATLAHIKSKMLLPPDPNAEADDADSNEDELDPRAELILRLLEYQKYKAAAEALAARGIAGRDVFFRGTQADEAQGPAPLAEVGLYKLLDAFQGVLERSKIDFSREISAESITIQERMTQIIERLSLQRRATFDELFVGLRSTHDVVVTFLALLEMAKMQLLRVYQADALSPLYLESAVSGEHDESPLDSADENVHPSPPGPDDEPS
jgi:segregation and condensation protein A